jgi:D-alanine-D-alanine ligase
MNVLLLAGGWSQEREVSLNGAAQIKEALLSRGHTVTLFDPAEKFDHLLEVAAVHDVAFRNMHGAPGEDGLVQAMLERAGCPYQGSDAAGSFLALHKAAAKQLFRANGLNTADWIFLPTRPESGWRPHIDYPLFVKSNNGGSSVHAYSVNDERDLAATLDALFDAGQEVLIEPRIDGVELTCAVLGREALPPVLITPAGKFFDYHSKYAKDGALEQCPAPIAPQIDARVRHMALTAHNCLGLYGYSRSDFILTTDECLFILETNTIPGMTSTSLVPKEAAAIGLDFTGLVERLLELALAAHNAKVDA